MKIRKLVLILPLLLVFIFACGQDKEQKVKDGVAFATRALESANANALSRATFQGYMRNGNPVDYIKAILPQKDAVWTSYEFKEPTHPWTVVIRPGTEPGEYYIEGYGNNTKQPLQGAVQHVTINVPEE